MAAALPAATPRSGATQSAGAQTVVPADVPPEAREAVARVVEAGLMDAPAGAFRPLEPMARIEVAKVLYRLAQVVAPQLAGQQGLPQWWRGLSVPRAEVRR